MTARVRHKIKSPVKDLESSAMIHVVSLNPTMDIPVPPIPGYEKGVPGGKGMNVARQLSTMGHHMLNVYALVGGPAGDAIENYMKRKDIAFHPTLIGESTVSVEIYDGDERMQRGEKPTIHPHELSMLAKKVMDNVRPGDYLVLSGSLPKNVPETTFMKLISESPSSVHTVVDTAEEGPFRHSVTASPTIMKPNREEFQAYLNANRELSLQEIACGAMEVHASKEIDTLLVSLDKDGAMLAHNGHVYHGRIPEIDVQCSVGSGDVLLAAYVLSRSAACNPEANLQYALAAASSHCQRPGNIGPDMDEVIDLRRDIAVERVL